MRWPPSATQTADHAGGPDDVDTVATLRAVRAAVLAYGLGRFDDALDLLAGTPRDGLSATAATVVRLRRAQFTLWHRGPAAARAVLAETGPYDPSARHHAGAGAGAEVSALALTGRAGRGGPAAGTSPSRSGRVADEIAAGPGADRGGDLSAAEELAEKCYALAARARLPLAQLWFAGGLGRTSLLRGRPRLALWWYRRAARAGPPARPAAAPRAGRERDDDGGRLARRTGRRCRTPPPRWDRRRRSTRSDPAMFPGDLARGPAWRLMARRRPGGRARGPGGGAGRPADGRATSPRRRTRRTTGCGSGDPATWPRPWPTLAAQRRRHAAGALAGARGRGGGRRRRRARAAAERLPGLGLVLSAAEAASEAPDPAAPRGDPRRAAALRRRRAGWVAERPRARGRRRCSPAGPARPTGSRRGSARSRCWSPRAAVQGDRRGARAVGPYRRQPPAAGLRQAGGQQPGRGRPPPWGRSRHDARRRGPGGRDGADGARGHRDGDAGSTSCSSSGTPSCARCSPRT